MSLSRQRARELVSSYDLILERQIVEGGSHLVCKDENLWKLVEGLLKDGDAQETHCLGLDPLQVMQDSFKAEATKTTAGGGHTRGGLRGLAKAFEVLEQAALNLYLGPWREEYKFVKMYSGVFTHYIKPVLSIPLIEKLFGLLGYRPCPGPHQQLQLQSRVSAGSLDSLLCLSCAFFLARCECCLLLAALGKHSGEAQWELSLVMERQRGHSLQVAMDNTKKMLAVGEPLEVIDGEVDLDLYTDDVRDVQAKPAVCTGDGPRSLSWGSQSSTLTSTGKAHSNGVMSMSSISRESVCIATLSCQLSSSSPPASSSTGTFSSGAKQVGRHRDEPTNKGDSQSHGRHGDVMRACEAERFSSRADEGTEGCSALHVTSALRHLNEHSAAFPDMTAEEMNESRAASAHSGSLSARGAAVEPTLIDSDPTAVTPVPQHIAYHDCCDLAALDPQVLCRTCWVFHCDPCREMEVCQAYHAVDTLGVCSCGRVCSRNPLVLCRYCGAEYCRQCWYRNPVSCTCGQIFDQSSSV